jgi:Proteasome subunit
MSLVLAMKATDGVVLASDSQATSGDQIVRTRTEARKLEDLHGMVAFGCAGDAGLRQRVVLALRRDVKAIDCKQSLDVLRPLFHQIVNPLQQEARAEYVNLPGTEPSVVSMLFAGVSRGRKWLYEINADGKDEEHELAEAIGSARHYAINGMVYQRHLRLAGRPIQQVRLAAYRIVMNSILADGTGSIGIPVQLYEVRDGVARLVPKHELKLLQDTLDVLNERERDLWQEPISADELSRAVDGVRVD